MVAQVGFVEEFHQDEENSLGTILHRIIDLHQIELAAEGGENLLGF